MYRWDKSEELRHAQSKREYYLERIMKVFNQPGDIKFNTVSQQIEIKGKPVDFDVLVVDLDVNHGLIMNKTLCVELITYLAKRQKYNPNLLHLKRA